MTKRWVYITPLLIAFGLGAILYTAIGKDPTRLETARLNEPIPDFHLNSLQDQNRKLTVANLKGHVILLNVWATWCPTCRAEHEYLVHLAKQGVTIAGINYKDDRADALKWLSTLGNPYEFNVYDPQGTLGFDLGVYGAPETYVIDSKGFVRYRRVGVVTDTVWKKTLLPLMNKIKLEEKKQNNKVLSSQ